MPVCNAGRGCLPACPVSATEGQGLGVEGAPLGRHCLQPALPGSFGRWRFYRLPPLCACPLAAGYPRPVQFFMHPLAASAATTSSAKVAAAAAAAAAAAQQGQQAAAAALLMHQQQMQLLQPKLHWCNG